MKFDEIRNKVSTKYSAFDIELEDTVVSLENVLRLPAERRNKVVDIQTKMTEEGFDGDVVEEMKKIIDLLIKDKASAAKLHKAIGGDAAFYAEIMELYAEGTDLGKASE